MRNRYQEGYCQGFKKAQAEGQVEIDLLREEIGRLTKRINDLSPKDGLEEIALDQGGISDRLSNFDDWGDQIRPRT
jgi:uncharacterized coiled-coil protein SlyX